MAIYYCIFASNFTIFTMQYGQLQLNSHSHGYTCIHTSSSSNNSYRVAHYSYIAISNWFELTKCFFTFYCDPYFLSQIQIFWVSFIDKNQHLRAKEPHSPSPELKIVGICDGVRHNRPSSSGGLSLHCDFITPTAIITMKQIYRKRGKIRWAKHSCSSRFSRVPRNFSVNISAFL